MNEDKVKPTEKVLVIIYFPGLLHMVLKIASLHASYAVFHNVCALYFQRCPV